MTKRFKKLISLVLTLVITLSVVTVAPISASAATTSQNNIVGWANYLYDITWTAQRNVSGWKGNYTFYQGNTYRIPYGQPVTKGKYIGYGVSVDDFVASTKDANSVFYTTKSYYSGYSSNSTYYATDCSAFVSLCWGIPRSTTYSIPNYGKNLGRISSSTVNNLQIGDCLNSNSDGHVVLVTDVTYSGSTVTSVEITEQTPPQLKRSTYTASQLVSKYNSKNYIIYRYEGSVPAPPVSTDDFDNYIDLGTDFYAYIEHQSTGLYLTNQNTNVAGEIPTGNNNQIWKFIRQPNGAYALQSNSNGYYMDVFALDEDNANVYTWSEYLNTSNQQFFIYYQFGAYYFRPAHSLTRMLDMSSTDDHNLSLWSAGKDWAPQEFNITKIDVNGNLPINLGNEFHAYIEHQNTGLYLTNQNTNVAGEIPTGNNNQIWKFIRQPNGAYALQSNSNGYYMDVFALDEDNANVYTWSEYLNTSNQQFFIYYQFGAYYFRPAHSLTRMLDMSSTDDHNLSLWSAGKDWAPQEFNINKLDIIGNLPVSIGDEFCAKIKNPSSEKYLSAVGDNVEGADANCEKQQVWYFYRLSDNSYKIKNYYDWRAMDVHNHAEGGPGTNVQVYNDWDVTAQRFYIYEVYGAYYIKPVCTDMVLDLNQTTYNLEVWGAGTNREPQKFNIEKINTEDIGKHSYSEKFIKPTLEEKGYTEHTCNICGDSYKDNYTVLADANLDGSVSVDDVTHLQMHIARYTDSEGNALIDETNESIFAIADIDGDGMLTISDATDLQMILAGYEL